MADTSDTPLPTRVKDIRGQRFGRLTVVRFAAINSGHAAMWTCLCDCGKEHTTQGITLRLGNCNSCGCYKSDVSKKKATKHGLCQTSEYNAWASAKKRCTNPAHPAYADYGGRGIHMCDRWKNSFQAFIEDLGRKPTPFHSLDRKNNELGYSPDNCVWAERSEQAKNRRSNRFITHDGHRRTITDWGRRIGGKEGAINGRIERGWSIEDAVTIPVDQKKGSRQLRREPEDELT